jgi:hypothetical protein
MHMAYFANGTVSCEGYVCILEGDITESPSRPPTIITTDRDKALRLNKDYGYQIFCTTLYRKPNEK